MSDVSTKHRRFRLRCPHRIGCGEIWKHLFPGNHVIKRLERLYELRDLLQIKRYHREPNITLEGFPAFPKTAF
jgi:hypothetical protein